MSTRALRHFSLWAAVVVAVLALPGGSSGAPERVLSTGEIYLVSAAGERRALWPRDMARLSRRMGV
jgi:hypothetical protein